jgi:hypothetical protein
VNPFLSILLSTSVLCWLRQLLPYATPPRPHSCLHQSRRHDSLIKKVSSNDAAACGLIYWRKGTIILYFLPIQLQPSHSVTTSIPEPSSFGASTWEAITIACPPAIPASALLALWGLGYTVLWVYTHSVEPFCTGCRMVNT